MDYLEQVFAFQRWKEVNPLPASAIALWHEIIAVCDKAGWPEEFTIQNAVLQATAGLSRKEFDRARQMLIDIGLIHYKKSQRVNSAGRYTFNPFPIVQKGQQEGQREGHRTAHGRDNERDNYKDLKDFKDFKSTATAATAREETFAQAHERVWRRSLTPFQNGHLGQYIDNENFEQAVVIRAIERAALKGTGYQFGLITKILNDYAASGAKTLTAAEALDEQFEAAKQGASRVFPVRDTTTSRRQRDLDDLDKRLEEAKKRERDGNHYSATGDPQGVRVGGYQ